MLGRRPSTIRAVQFSEEEFVEEDFDLAEFTEARTRAAIEAASTEASDGTLTFNAKHIKVMLENCTRDLEELRGQASARIRAKEQELRNAAPQYEADVEGIMGAYEDVQGMFDDLDGVLEAVGDGAVRVGSRLQATDLQRKKAVEVRDLLTYFNQLNSGNAREHDSIFTYEPHTAAPIIRMLAGIADELDMDKGVDTAKTAIAAYDASISQVLLNDFSSACTLQRTEEMTRCATSLALFDGGKQCVETYLANHRFFKDFGRPHGSRAGGAGELETAEREFTALYREVLEACSAEHELVRVVFAAVGPETVLQRFVATLFQHIATFVKGARGLGPPRKVAVAASPVPSPADMLTYLRKLTLAHGKTYELTAMLEEQVDPLKLFTRGSKVVVDDVFRPYTRNYSECELYALSGLSDAMVHDALKDFMPEEKAGFLRRRGRRRAESEDDLGRGSGSFALTTCPVSQTVVQSLIDLHTEAIGRAVTLSLDEALPYAMEESETADNVFRTWKSLVERLCGYLSQALDIGLEVLPSTDAKTSPVFGLTRFFELAANVNKAVVLLQQSFKEHVLPGIAGTDNVNHRTNCLGALKSNTKTLEQKLISGLEGCVKTIANYTHRLLSQHQAAEDFKPREDDFSPAMEATAACRAACDFVGEVAAAVQGTLDQRNQDLLLAEVGARLRHILLLHIRKYTINSMGALKLLKDIGVYQECVRQFSLPTVDQSFEVLREVGNLYLVQPQNLRSLVEEGRMVGIDRAEVLEHIRMRADFKAENVGTMFRDR